MAIQGEQKLLQAIQQEARNGLTDIAGTRNKPEEQEERCELHHNIREISKEPTCPVHITLRYFDGQKIISQNIIFVNLSAIINQ